MVGHCEAGAVKRAFGCAAFAPVFFADLRRPTLPCQSMHSAGGLSVMPSHHTPPSGVSAMLVNIVFGPAWPSRWDWSLPTCPAPRRKIQLPD